MKRLLVVGVAMVALISACGSEPASNQYKRGAPSGDSPAASSAPVPGSPSERSISGAEQCPIFPADNPWNTDISGLPVHPLSNEWVASIGSDGLHPDFGSVWEGEPIGIPYVINTERVEPVEVVFVTDDESDPGPYPIPSHASVEGGDDEHVIVLDNPTCRLYEMYDATRMRDGSWEAESGAVFNLRSNDLRPDTCTSADAAGLPIYPGLVRYDEVVERGVIDHALRFTAEETREAFIHPATHWASDKTSESYPPMGARFRLRADFDCGDLSNEIQVVCAALKRYGMFLADNGSNWFVTGATDSRWNDEALSEIAEIPGSAFEAVETGEAILTRENFD